AEDKNKLTKKVLENDSDDENEDDNTNNLIGDSKNIEINKKEKIELDLQNAITKYYEL
ncbi:5091_t:CDS:2, partial [Gigaspora margarita]